MAAYLNTLFKAILKATFKNIDKFDNSETNKGIAKFGFNEFVKFDISQNVNLSDKRGIYIFTIEVNSESQQFENYWNTHRQKGKYLNRNNN